MVRVEIREFAVLVLFLDSNLLAMDLCTLQLVDFSYRIPSLRVYILLPTKYERELNSRLSCFPFFPRPIGYGPRLFCLTPLYSTCATMTSVTTAALSDALPSSVPKLEASGLNWAIFLVRFRDAVDAKGFWGHFDGTTPAPSLSTSPTAAETAAKGQWEKDERSAKSLLTQKLPDSTLMRVHTKGTVRERWVAVVKEYTEKGAYAQTDMRAKFLASRCPEKGNVRDFLDELQTKREELVQVGVDIDAKDYLSTIISSLPFSLSNFASAQLAAAKMFSSTKSIDPEVLMSLLMEEADRQKAQAARRRGSGKGSDEVRDEALVAGEGSSKKGRRANITCWTCHKKGHYQNECKEPKDNLPDDGQKTQESQGPKTAALAVGIDSGDEGAWSVEAEPDEMDWFEMAVAEMEAEHCEVKALAVEIPARDWFYEVAESDDESEDEGASSGGVSVGGFDSDTSEGTNPEDLGVIGQFWPDCDDDIFEGADRLSSTLLGPCQDEAPVAPVVYPEGEFGGEGITCEESSGRLPDLDVFENPWIDATMEWRIHATTLRASDEVVTRPSKDHKGGEDDPDMQVHEGCYMEVIELLKDAEGPGIDDVYEECSSVPHFEGEEDDRYEKMDLPVAEHSVSCSE
jgi:hypothetical protein